jgi:hypothetical protein
VTNLYVIRNIRQRDALIERIKAFPLPFKVLYQDMKTIRTVDWNGYYFGVALVLIAEKTGHYVDELHEYLALKFRIKYYYNPTLKRMVFERTSTTADNIWEFSDYVEQVCAWAWLFLRVQIPHPNEIIHPEKVNEVKLQTI